MVLKDSINRDTPAREEEAARVRTPHMPPLVIWRAFYSLPLLLLMFWRIFICLLPQLRHLESCSLASVTAAVLESCLSLPVPPAAPKVSKPSLADPCFRGFQINTIAPCCSGELIIRVIAHYCFEEFQFATLLCQRIPYHVWHSWHLLLQRASYYSQLPLLLQRVPSCCWHPMLF